METERYNSRLTPPSLPNSSRPLPALPCPAHLLHADKRLYESIVTNCRGNCCGRLCLAGMIHSDKRRGLLWIVLIWCHVNISGLNPRRALLSLVDHDRQRPKASALMTCETQDGHSDCSANRSGRWFYKFQCTPWAPVACLAHKQ